MVMGIQTIYLINKDMAKEKDGGKRLVS